MRHVDPEVLALLALGEHVALPEDTVHVSECDLCRREIEVLSRAAMVGRSTFDAGELLEAPSRVWDRINDELSLASSAPDVEGASAAPSQTSESVLAAPPQGATVHSLSERRRPWVGIVAAAAAVALVASAGTALWSTLRPAAQPTILASATLDAFPNWPDASGEAKLEQLPDGTRVVEVNLDVPVTAGGYREVWLITTDATALVSLGIVEGTSGQFTVPEGLDVTNYALVDISEEQFDGDPSHSGDSIVRGELSAQA